MWQEKDGALYRKFEFKDFDQAFQFMQAVAAEAERQNHHPRWHNKWNVVEIWLSTHDAGDKVTDRDRKLAKAIDNLYKTDPGGLKAITKAPEHTEIKLYADGGSRGNPGPSASGFVLLDMDDNIIFKTGVYLGITTNNQAEYQALKFGLEQAQKLGAREVMVFMDSLLVINQLKGIFKVKNRDLWPIYVAIQERAKNFKKVTYQHVPRELNKLADAEVNTTLDAELNKN
ncbi:MAG TPA: 4a-hydroxytetrahydrobiopterin dehydratase [Patescibacteria group bacterium]|nr:4a-hydroxytetrahydrobiopterin dehydratase [Patescibacteria group bacterium]